MAAPKYYIGKTHKYEASKVVEDFQADSYNIGTALTYLMRAGRKVYVNGKSVDSKEEDIRKAIDHLQFELNRINADKETEANLIYENTSSSY
tara:strand:- start:11904 stop:12179 length:276 start_codon:yes stop_codon:yes gene_type:complete